MIGTMSTLYADGIENLKFVNALNVLAGSAPANGGFNTEGDVITQTVDGFDLNTLWTEFQQTIQLRNADRSRLMNFLTYPVNEPVVQVPQFGGGAEFEVASEFGVPRANRTEASYFEMGFAFEWYDTANRFTWRFLAEATQEQVASVNNAVLEADNRLMFNEIMRTLFDNNNRVADIRNRAYTVSAFYNGDGTVPPPHKTNTFDGTHNHYLVSGAATIDSGDLDDVIEHIQHHGYTPENGVSLVIMVNKREGDAIRNIRSIANGGTALYDFIPAQGTPNLLLPREMVPANAQPAGTIRGMKVIGSYSDATIVQEDFIPAGYVVGFATGGADSLTNPIGIREHRNPALRGLRLVKGRSADYPLQDAIYQRGFGTGVRQRGAAVVMQIKATGTYEAPPAYAR